MIATIRKGYKFEAAHFLPNHKGQCRNMHGHSYKVELFVQGEVETRAGTSDEGMVLDFKMLDKLAKPYIDEMDHQTLNHVPSMVDWLQGRPPTAENIAGYLFAMINAAVRMFIQDRQFRVTKVRVWETDSCYAEVGEE